MIDDYQSLPDDLLAPIDDGAADRLRGLTVPPVSLAATGGGLIDLAQLGDGLTVLYVYPMTGTPGVALPDGWDEIPGARGCTPESVGFRDEFMQLRAAGADAVYGVSTQDLATQRDLVSRLTLPYELLADPELALGEALGLPSFTADGVIRYRRLTLIVRGGRVEHVFHPVFPPDGHAAEVVSWLRARELARRETALTEEVLARFAHTPSPRLRELVEALVRHLHGFAREVRLGEAEWEAAIDGLTRTGQITDARRQEFVLLSDILGLSMLTIGIGAPADPVATEPTVFGPFFVREAPVIDFGGDVAQGAAGEPCWVEGQVVTTAGAPVADAQIEVWEADADGFYDVQYDDGRTAGRARMRADAEGRYGFWSVKPAPYPIPHDGPVGELLRATRRSPMRPAHIHFMVSAPDCRTLVTHVFDAASPHLDDDAVFGVKASLVRDVEPMAPTPDGPAGRALATSWWRLRFDVALAPATGGH